MSMLFYEGDVISFMIGCIKNKNFSYIFLKWVMGIIYG